MTGGAPTSSATFRLTVRSHELDAYGHFNNAVYQQWFEEGREALLQAAVPDGPASGRQELRHASIHVPAPAVLATPSGALLQSDATG